MPQAEVTGNPCLLEPFYYEPSTPPLCESGVTVCQSWRVNDSATQQIALRCYLNGQLIQCCGHGLLATAYYWQRQLKRDALDLTMNLSQINSWREGELTWLRFNTLTTTPCALPGWIAEAFPAQAQPTCAATAGGENGYLILQWPDAFQLKELPQLQIRLGKYTQRALICTSAQPDAGEGAIQLRYLAPQHGAPEDSATGSAMRVLSHYWSQRFEHLAAWQCSAEGGHLLATFKGEQVEIGGRCLPTAKTQHAPRETLYE